MVRRDAEERLIPAGADAPLACCDGVISPLLSSIYLHVLDRVWAKHGRHLRELVRYADDFVVMSRQARECEEAQARIGHVLGRLGLKLHPQKTRRVVLTAGREGFDFLGCHLHKRMSGRLWEQKGLKRYDLHRWPSQRAMKHVRARVRELTPRRCCHRDIRSVIAEHSRLGRKEGPAPHDAIPEPPRLRLDEVE